MKQTPSIVFLGTGPVAARSLELLSKHCTIEAVITKPRPAHHKGSVPVLEQADSLNVPVVTISNKSELDHAVSTRKFKSPVGIVIDFGIIISEQTIEHFPRGILNSHFSVLPELRGADPITFAILNGQSTTGVSLMRIVPALDEGPLLGYNEHPLSANIDTPTLTSELIEVSDQLIRELLPSYLDGTLQPKPQSITGRQSSYTRKLSKQDAQLVWAKSAAELEREIRAFLGWPGSKAMLGSIEVTIEKAHVRSGNGVEGTIIIEGKTLAIQTAEGQLVVEQLKPAGKNSMTADAFLAGYASKLV